MKFALRVDASLQIGTGHVMRCLTLADAIEARGGDCQFICRDHPGSLIDFVRNKGYQVHLLPPPEHVPANGNEPLNYASWLGASQDQDADECAAILGRCQPDWLIVDHYALDARWESALAAGYRKLLAIDDLANRAHHCELLLDQTYGRSTADYQRWVPAGCSVLCGAQYALLRPEFSAQRSSSLQRREHPQLQQLLVTMGGVDLNNVTGQVLAALRLSPLPADCRITVVMGATAPWLDDIRHAAEEMPWPSDVLAGASNMAQLMADCDLAIGAAGSTSWELCCLGIPALILVLADNQRALAQGLKRTQAAVVMEGIDQIADLPRLLRELVASPERRAAMSRIAADIVDGRGTANVISHLEC